MSYGYLDFMTINLISLIKIVYYATNLRLISIYFLLMKKDFYYSIVRIVNFIKIFQKFNHIILSFQQDNDGNPWERILDTKFPIVFFEGFIFYKYKIDAGKKFLYNQRHFSTCSKIS